MSLVSSSIFIDWPMIRIGLELEGWSICCPDVVRVVCYLVSHAMLDVLSDCIPLFLLLEADSFSNKYSDRHLRSSAQMNLVFKLSLFLLLLHPLEPISLLCPCVSIH